MVLSQLSIFGSTSYGEDSHDESFSASAVALLKGVELVRMHSDSIRVTIEIKHIKPKLSPPMLCKLEISGDKLRSEVRRSGDQEEIVIRDGDEFMGFRRDPHEDVQLYDLDRAVGIRGDLAFDPRTLGLDDVMSCDISMKGCLWYEEGDQPTVVGRDTIAGANVWKVEAKRGVGRCVYWIEEPSFRVHRKTIDFDDVQIIISSEYDIDSDSALPSRVTASRKEGKSEREVVYTLVSVDEEATISPERFAMKSMGLPVNTAVVDYGTHRIVGYWNGENQVKDPVYLGEISASPSVPETQNGWRLYIVGINVAVVLGLMAILWRRRLHKVSGT